MPDADYLYACDERWWQINMEAIKRDFRGELYTQWHNDKTRLFAAENGIQAVQGRGAGGLGLDKIHHGSNSGYQAINLAYLLGATRIILLGYDMGQTGGKNHWFGDHPEGMTNGNYQGFVSRFTQLAKDLEGQQVEVINCTRQTNLHQFRREPLENVI